MHANATPSEIAIFNKLANPARVSKTPRDPVAKPQSVFETAVIQELKSVAMNREQGKAGSDRDSDRRDKSDRGGDQSDRGSDKREEYREQQHELDRRSSQDLETSRNNDAEVFAEQQQREMQQQMQQREQPSKEDEDSEPQEEGAVTSQGEDSGNASDSRSISVPGSHGNARRGRGSRRRKAPKNLRV